MNSPQPDVSAPPESLSLSLLLSGRTVLLLGHAPAEAARLRRAGAVLRSTQRFSPADLDGVALCMAPAGHPALAEAASRGILASPLPARARAGRASLVGAGPGSAGMLTLRAAELIRSADVVLFDKLVGPDVLAMARPDARMIDVGKRCGRHAMSQAAINALIARHAQAGAHVVRLKGGDPFVFGRGGEELESLREAGVPCEVVPGITAALAAAAGLGIPLTNRGSSRSLHLITAHGADDRLPEHDWQALARAGGTLAVYMGVRTLPLLAQRLLEAGLDGATPAVAVENASRPNERRVRGSLGQIAAMVAEAGLDGPTLVLIGAVVAQADVAAVERRVAA